MSIKATRKELKENYNCIGCGYCNAQDLLYYTSPTFYNTGVYGWNFDGYILRNSENGRQLLLTTGYRNTIHHWNIDNDWEIIHKYNEKAKELRKVNYYNYTRDQAQNLIDALIDEVYNISIEKHTNATNKSLTF